MPKTLSCRDVGVDCDFQATGDTVEEVLAQTAEHAKTAHGYDGIPPELAAKVQAAIKDK
jgi:predicted small metal-binding protein